MLEKNPFFACYFDKYLTIITSSYLKITSCRWLKENNRLLFSVTGIDNQGHSHIIGTWVPTQGPHNVLHTALYLRASYSKMSGKAGNSSWNIIFWQKLCCQFVFCEGLRAPENWMHDLKRSHDPFADELFHFSKSVCMCVWSSKI